MISFNLPYYPKKFFKSVKNLKKYFSIYGPVALKLENLLKKKLRSKEVILTHSCTGALEISALLLNLKKNDEIILPSYAFVSTANAFALTGAKLIFADISKNDFNISYEEIKKKVTKKTKAIIVIHYAGYSKNIDIIAKFAQKNGIFLIEDAAQAFLIKFKKKYLGTFGDLATFSFHETKNIHCGNGGALIINNSYFTHRAKIISDKGTDRYLFNQKKIKYYSWKELGSSYKLSEINSLFLYEVYKKYNIIKNKRKILWETYYKNLLILNNQKLINFPNLNFKDCENAYHSFCFTVKESLRNKLIKFLHQKNIDAVFHYIPLHQSNFIKKKYLKKKFFCKNSEKISKSIIRLPMHFYLTQKQIKYICDNIKIFFKLNG